MLGRLDRAAVRACGASAFSVRELQVAVRRTACYRDAMDRRRGVAPTPRPSARSTASAPPPAGAEPGHEAGVFLAPPAPRSRPYMPGAHQRGDLAR